MTSLKKRLCGYPLHTAAFLMQTVYYSPYDMDCRAGTGDLLTDSDHIALSPHQRLLYVQAFNL